MLVLRVLRAGRRSAAEVATAAASRRDIWITLGGVSRWLAPLERPIALATRILVLWTRPLQCFGA